MVQERPKAGGVLLAFQDVNLDREGQVRARDLSVLGIEIF